MERKTVVLLHEKSFSGKSVSLLWNAYFNQYRIRSDDDFVKVGDVLEEPLCLNRNDFVFNLDDLIPGTVLMVGSDKPATIVAGDKFEVHINTWTRFGVIVKNGVVTDWGTVWNVQETT